MIIFAIDDEPKALKVLCRAIKGAAPDAELREFDNAADVFSAVEGGTRPDVLFSDADMPGMSGVELARQMKRSCPDLNVIFATGYDDYMRDAFSIHASGYLKNPLRRRMYARSWKICATRSGFPDPGCAFSASGILRFSLTMFRSRSRGEKPRNTWPTWRTGEHCARRLRLPPRSGRMM